MNGDDPERSLSAETDSDSADAPGPGPEGRRPTLRSAVLSLPFLTNTICGWLLVACFWLPLAVGCDKKTVLTPAGEFRGGLPGEPEEVIALAYVDWPYAFGGALALTMVALAIIRPRRIVRWLLPVPLIVLTALLLFGLLICSLGEQDRSVQDRLILALYLVAPPLVALVWVAAAIRSGDRLLIATRANCASALMMPLAFYAHGALSLISRFLVGFYVSVLVSIALTISTWFIYTRGEQAFCDQNAPRRRVQFRIRTLMVWTLLIAIFSAVIQNASD